MYPVENQTCKQICRNFLSDYHFPILVLISGIALTAIIASGTLTPPGDDPSRWGFTLFTGTFLIVLPLLGCYAIHLKIKKISEESIVKICASLALGILFSELGGLTLGLGGNSVASSALFGVGTLFLASGLHRRLMEDKGGSNPKSLIILLAALLLTLEFTIINASQDTGIIAIASVALLAIGMAKFYENKKHKNETPSTSR